MFSIARSSTKVFDSADICGPHNKVRLMKNAKPELLLSVPLDSFLVFILWFIDLLFFPVWWFFIWGLEPKPSKTILMPSCLHITKTISFSITLNSRIPGFYCRVGLYVAFVKYVNVHSLTFDPPAEFLSFYGLLNFYLYTLAFVYSPSKNALYGRWSNTKQNAWKCLYSPVNTVLFYRHPVQR